MALTPTDEIHALQIQAGVIGRKAGHAFEDAITSEINALSYPVRFPKVTRHVSTGSPAEALLSYVASVYGSSQILNAVALSTGALATSEDGKKWLEVNGVAVKRCKSDLILTLRLDDYSDDLTVGVSTKQCNNKTPTNAQLYFTTARGFANLLQSNGISVSDEAVTALRRFCGDIGYRPLDFPDDLEGRVSDPRRYFWEEIGYVGRLEWEAIFSDLQDEETRLLLQKATDLHNWQRVGDGFILDLEGPNARFYEVDFAKGIWHDRAMRDPWVMRDHEGDGWLMYFTARASGIDEANAGGCIGLATSLDGYSWTLEPPVFYRWLWSA